MDLSFPGNSPLETPAQITWQNTTKFTLKVLAGYSKVALSQPSDENATNRRFRKEMWTQFSRLTLLPYTDRTKYNQIHMRRGCKDCNYSHCTSGRGKPYQYWISASYTFTVHTHIQTKNSLENTSAREVCLQFMPAQRKMAGKTFCSSNVTDISRPTKGEAA